MKLRSTFSAENGPSTAETEPEYYVLGGGSVGEAIASRLLEDGYPTAVIDETLTSTNLPGDKGDPTDLELLRETGLSANATVIVATRTDRRNLLIAQLVRSHFDPARILVFVNSADRYDLFEETGHEPVCVTSVLTETVVADL